MSKYNPRARPFWEKEKGGPISDLMSKEEELRDVMRVDAELTWFLLSLFSETGDYRFAPEVAPWTHTRSGTDSAFIRVGGRMNADGHKQTSSLAPLHFY